MKFKHSLLMSALIGALGVTSAVAGERETVSYGSKAPSANEVQTFLFPEAECENAKYQCLAVRPSTERSIGMDVRFQTGSSELTPAAKAQLQGLGQALASRNGKLKPGEIVIEGHADARGSADLNKRLSHERAQAVVKHLVSAHSVDGKVLKPVGVGKDRLKDAARPESEVNRRVELVRSAI
jgi:outer membrane protein OmpA-like peptidoglycan-associated protein